MPKPVVEVPDLTNISDVDLLQSMVEITLRDGPLSDRDRKELDAINDEFQRRDSLAYLPTHSRNQR